MKSTLFKMFSAAMILALTFSFLSLPQVTVQAVSPNIVISQVYGGGGNSGATYKNDFIELFNRGTAAVDVSGWSVQYASSTGTTWKATLLSGTIQPGQYYLVQEAAGSGGTVNLPTPDASGSIAMSASSGKVALVGNSTALSGSCLTGVVDSVGFGSANCFEGSAAAPGLNNTTAALRANGGCTDTDDNAADFATGDPDPRNSASPLHSCTGPTDPTGVGAANPASLFAGDAVLLTVAVTPGGSPTSTGLGVTCDLSTIGGASDQALYDDGSNGDVTAGDNTFSFATAIGANTTSGSKSLNCTVSDAEVSQFNCDD